MRYQKCAWRQNMTHYQLYHVIFNEAQDSNTLAMIYDISYRLCNKYSVI